MEPVKRDYLGDGVYASFNGCQIWLTVDREGREEQVCLEPEVYAALLQYAERVGFTVKV